MDLDFTQSIQEKMSMNQMNRLRNLERGVGTVKPVTQTDREKQAVRLREVSEDFESILIDQMLSEMRKTLSKERLYGGGMAEDIFQGMLDDEYSKMMAKGENFGLAEKIYEQLSKFL